LICLFILHSLVFAHVGAIYINFCYGNNYARFVVKLDTCKEDFAKERKDYEDQLQRMRNEKQQVEEQCQEKLPSPPKVQVNNGITIIQNTGNEFKLQ